MKSFKRVTGLVLALLLVVGMVPTGVLADTVTYTGIDARVYNTNIGGAIQDAQPNIQFATDEMSEIHKPDASVKVNGTWYHTVDSLDAVPSAQQAQYSKYTYDTFEVYARAATNDETFVKDNTYLYVAQLTPTAGVFDELCLIGPIGGMYADITTNSATVYIPVTPTDAQTIDWINFTCSNDGNVIIKDTHSDWVYLYEVNDGSVIADGMYGAPIGQHVLNNAECKALSGSINVKNTPVITLYAVSADEWDNGRTAQVLAYGTYTIPMSDPYITVDNLVFGESTSIIEIGTETGGKYHWNTASASFKGWFTDKEGKNPATAEADAYAIFTLRSYGLFDPDIEASDFTLKCGYDRYVGEYLLPKTDSNAYTVAFFVPSNRISITLEVVGEGGTMSFINYPDSPSISLRPRDDGYAPQDIAISIEPGYYAKSLTVNGETWDDIRNPFNPQMNAQIAENEAFETGIMSFTATTSTVIRLELAPADRITIDYGNNVALYTGLYADEFEWHESGQYWASESYTTLLCSTTAIIDAYGTKHMKSLNTKPDGSGVNAKSNGTHFYWESPEEYTNGISDSITLYVIMECNAHVEYGADDSAWEYREAKAATCTEDGYVAHRYCPNCEAYQVKDANGDYVDSTLSDVTIKKLPHEHTQYTSLNDKQHNVKCAHCDDNYNENHKLVNGVCVCGYYTYIKGDVNGDGYVTDADAVHLLYYTIFPEDYPINQPADFNGDGYVTDADAVYLLYYTIFPEDYPLQ